MADAPLLVVQHGNVLQVTFNRPDKYNAISLEMLDGLRAATATFRDRDDLRVLLVTANGRYFSAGIDLHGALVPPTDVAGPSAFRRWYRQGAGSLHPLGDEWEAIEKPVVVAWQGPCLGGALELSLCADFRLATAETRLGLPEIALGGIPGSGGTSRLVRLAGPHWAKWLILANKQIDAEQARAIGLVHDVLPSETFATDVLQFCVDLAKQPAEAMAVGKLAIELAMDLDRAQGRNVERLAVGGLIFGDEYKTMMNAMQERLAQGKR